MVFHFYSKILNALKLPSFLNPKSAIQNPKSCLNGVFVQTLTILVYCYTCISSRNLGKFSISSVCIRKIPLGPDLALIHWESGWSNIAGSSGYDICPPSRASRSRPGLGTGRAGLNPISAKLFLCGRNWKNEHRTSNVQSRQGVKHWMKDKNKDKNFIKRT